ncbi:AraC family transcriptional regulator [Paenibacillus selenitireducens]|uniref:AraC family transcriptional regulator n=1 Tax=Paenibacillus selenitireducens TaxID=1324314 RepID=A0A1T2X9U5_9BACL|nr:helix-turn-helix domain-containing protein [Paenibacillus selenitireducens]OPA76661.1 AraC family transcriptional regulator [Paenibacillus selenitireducens]
MQSDASDKFKDVHGHHLIAGHYHESDTYLSKRLEGMKDWLITYTLDGEGYANTPEMEAVCRAGDLMLLKPEVPHQYGTRKGQHWHFVWAHFSPQQVQHMWLPTQEIYVKTIENTSVQRRIYRAFRKIIVDSTERGTYWSELCYNALQEVLILLAQRHQQKLDARVEEVLLLLSQSIREPWKIEGIARTIGLSPSRLSHLFKEQTGHSIIEALNQMRIRQAALLLAHTDRSAFEVSQDVGFHNYNHFMNQFRKYYFTTPTAYRNR